MPCKIVKPYDWQFVPETCLVVVIEGVDQPGHSLRLCSYDGYFKVAPGARRPLLEVAVEVLPGRIGRAVLTDVGPWGPCVLSVLDAAGGEIAASGVKFGRSQATSWQSGVLSPAQATEGFRYPVPLVTASVSHTYGEVRCDAAPAASMDELCSRPAGDGAALVGTVVLSQSRAYDGMRSLSPPHCLGSDEPSFGATPERAGWASAMPYLARFRDVTAHVPSGLVVFDAGLWSDSTLTAFFNDPELRQHPRLFRADGQVGFLGGASTEADLLAANGLERFPGIPMLLSNVGYRNHAHWIINSLLAAYYCRDMILAGRICVLVPENSDYILASLMALGIPRTAIVVATRGVYCFHDLLFPSTLSTHVNRLLPPEIAGMVDVVRAHCRARARFRAPRLVYLTRQGSGAQRKMSNEDQLIAALQTRGFVCIAPHELSFLEEVSCVAEADVIVGQLGAALVNIAFAPPTAWVVELASHNYVSPDYWVLATTLGQRFVRILAPVPGAGALTLTDFSFEIPLEATLASIDKVCEAARDGREARENR